MNVVKRDLSVWQYAIYKGVIILMLCGLTFLLNTCMKEETGGETGIQPGKRVPVNFAMHGIIHVENEVITHNYIEMNPEPVVIPLGNDLCMVATLETDPSGGKTRTATSNLDEGALLRIVAYLNGTTYHAHLDYTIAGNTLVSDGDLHVTANNEYRFVAYTHNSPTTLPGHHNDLVKNVDPSFHLLWGCYPKTGTILVTESSYEVIPITVSHQLSHVAIQITTADIENVTVDAVSNVSIVPGNKIHLSVKDNVLVAGGDTILTFLPAWLWMNSTTIVSEPRKLYANDAESLQVNIGSLILNIDGSQKTFSNLTATYSKQLKRGVSYTLNIHIKKLGNS